jgi:GT2 family glycosyltransferase
LESVQSAARLKDRPFEIVVIDNGSTDDSERRIRELCPGVPLLQTGENLGYAGGHNVGIRHALSNGADYVWLLNNDVELRPHSLAHLVETMEADKRRGILASSLDGPPDRRKQVSAWRVRRTVTRAMDPITCEGCSGGFHPASDLWGPSIFIRREVVEKIGLLDERYFHYFEERDFVERARRAGWRLGLACNSRVYHEHGHSLSLRSPQSHYYLLRNKLLYERKMNGSHPLATLSKNLSLLRTFLAPRYVMRTRDTRNVWATALAMWDGCRGRTGKRDLGARYGTDLPWGDA